MKSLLNTILFMLFFGCPLYGQPDGPEWEIKWQRAGLSFRGISVVDARTIWVSGSNSTIVRSQDGGNTWLADTVAAGERLDFRDIHALDDKRAYLMSAGPGVKSRIFFTADGGSNWELLHKNEFEQGFFNGFAFRSDSSAALVGDPIDGKPFVMIMRNGRDWQRVPPEQLPPMHDGEYGFAASGTNIAVHGSQHIWVATGGAAARIFRSVDSGWTWRVFETPVVSGSPSAGIFSIAFRDGRHGIIVGGDYQKPESSGTNVAITEDSGETWQLVQAPSVTYRSCVAFVPGSDRLVAVGERGSDFSPDGGRTWSSLKTGFHTIGVAPSGTVWAAGGGGRIAKLILTLE